MGRCLGRQVVEVKGPAQGDKPGDAVGRQAALVFFDAALGAAVDAVGQVQQGRQGDEQHCEQGGVGKGEIRHGLGLQWWWQKPRRGSEKR